MTTSNRECYLCNGSRLNNYILCDCSTNIINKNTIQCRSCLLPNCDTNCKNAHRKTIEAKIQNQVGVSQNQMNSILSSITIRGPNSNFSFALSDRQYSRIWGNEFNIRNQSDRKNPHYTINNNVPSRGSSTKSSITANRPGSTAPGGRGVDIKHGSYARYLGKIKANNISENTTNLQVNNRRVTNNKSFRFSIINTASCCN